MKLKKTVGMLQIKRLVYSKFLFGQGKKYLENTTSETYYNISVILFANAVEIAVQTIAFCLYGNDRTNEKISDVIKSLHKDYKLDTFAFTKTTEARNAIYHKVNFHTWNTCKEIEQEVEVALRTTILNVLKQDYDSISLTDLVENENIKKLLSVAEKHLSDKNVVEAVISSTTAFAHLEHRIINRVSHLQRHIKHDLHWEAEISWAKEIASYMDPPSFPAGNSFSKYIEEQINKKISIIVREFDIMIMMGASYEDYKYFLSIVPLYHVFVDGRVEVEKIVADAMQYTYSQAEFIYNFVLRTVLDFEPKLKPIEIRSLSKEVIDVIK